MYKKNTIDTLSRGIPTIKLKWIKVGILVLFENWFFFTPNTFFEASYFIYKLADDGIDRFQFS